MPEERIIYSTYKLLKQYPPDRVVLRDISLSFFHGAKIGVLGGNGAGKSTLPRIMAGEDTRFGGEARLADWAKVGFLSQEPELDPAKDVLGNIEEGVAPTRALLDRFNEISAGSPTPSRPTRWTHYWPRWARCRSGSTRSTAGTSTAS